VTTWTDVASSSALPEGERLNIELDGYYVTVVRYTGLLHAYEDRCTHDDAPLADAELADDSDAPSGVVVCPRHGARFCLKTGSPLSPPAYEPIKIFGVREHDGRIELAL
jgi:3-phenylpropionate/trans-cinnamate dioxygenase ferredoxin subunit